MMCRHLLLMGHLLLINLVHLQYLATSFFKVRNNITLNRPVSNTTNNDYSIPITMSLSPRWSLSAWFRGDCVGTRARKNCHG